MQLSLPTVGALLEIGLEEAAKGFLILICLERNEEDSSKTSIGLDKSLSDLITEVKGFSDKIDCQKHMVTAFKEHKVKTNILNLFGNLFGSVSPESITLKQYTKSFLKGLYPDIRGDFLEKYLSSPTVTNSISNHITDIKGSLTKLSQKTKESGFYVDWTGSSFIYPEIDNNTILRMANFFI